jgi:2-keto-3-deoxy-L-rhamnonate aldolase RhmA
MGKMGQVDDPEVVEAIDHVIKTCQAAGLAIGWFGVTADAVKPYLDRGCTLMTAGVDTLMLASAGKRLLETMRS